MVRIGSAVRASLTLGFGGFAVTLLASHPARAVPAFAAQTGQACVFCHIGAFGPQLTPAGRAFKIAGYTQTGGEGWRSKIPLAVYWQGSLTSTAKDLEQKSPPGTPSNAPHRYDYNNNFNVDQASLILAGGFGEHTGIFSQWTVGDNFSAFAMDNTDFRPYTTEFDIGESELRVGISLNNNPTVQDPYNSSFAWGYPFIQPSGTLQALPAADVMLSSGFFGNGQSSMGATVYLWYDRSLYLDFGLYTAQSHWLISRLGNNYTAGGIQGTAPYARAAYEWNWDEGSTTQQSAHVGLIFMNANVNPINQANAPSDFPNVTGTFGRDSYTDITLDGGYQFLGDGTHIGTVLANYTHERQGLKGTVNQYNFYNQTNYGSSYDLDKMQIALSYWYKNTYGLTTAWQGVWGKKNPVLYQASDVNGSYNNSPNSNTFLIEADWVPFGKEDSWARPFANLKVGLQYWIFTQFNGGSKNYDIGPNPGARNASNNNTIYLFAWQAF